MDKAKAAEVIRGVLESLLFILDQVPVPVQQLQIAYPIESVNRSVPSPRTLRKDHRKSFLASELVHQLGLLQTDLKNALDSIEPPHPSTILFSWGPSVTSPKATFIIQLPAFSPTKISSQPVMSSSSLTLRVSGQFVSNSSSNASLETFDTPDESRACVRWIMEHLRLHAIPAQSLHVLINIPIPSEMAQRSLLGAWQPRQAISPVLDSLANISLSPLSTAPINRPAPVGLAISTDGSPGPLEVSCSLPSPECVWLSWTHRIHGFTD